MIPEVIRNIFRTNLGVKRTERVLLFTDIPSQKERLELDESEKRSRLACMAFLTAEIGKGLAGEIIQTAFPATGTHGAEPPPCLWESAFGRKSVAALSRKGILDRILSKHADSHDIEAAEEILTRGSPDAVDAVIALSHFSTSHTRFRDFLTRICRARYASMPLFEVEMLEGPMNVDWKGLAAITRQTARKLGSAEKVMIKTENGTDISFSVKGRRALADTGILTAPGSFGNLPAGEAYVAPVEGTAQGRLVLEWAPTRILESPVTLEVKEGSVVDVSGEEPYAEQLRMKLSERKENCNIAELGIGTNSRAKRPDNILESEKIMGTIHIALGDNSTFGGSVKTPFHQDFVFFRPTVSLACKGSKKIILMKKGRFMV